MAEERQIAHQIQVDSESRITNQKIIATNLENVFTGTMRIPQGDSATDARNMFIQEILVNNIPQQPYIDSETRKKTVNLNISGGGSGGGYAVWNVTDSTGGKTPAQILSELPNANIGDLVIVQRGSAFTGYVIVGNSSSRQLVPLAPIKSISLSGIGGSKITADIDSNGNANLSVDEIEFQEIYVNNLYLDGKNIKTVIPDLSGISELQEVQNPTRMQDIADKLNELIGLLKDAANTDSL